MTALLEVRAVGKDFRAAGQELHILSGVSLTVAKGETLAITGPSGAGKSTLLGLMAGLDRPSRGEVLYNGQALSAWDEERLSLWRRQSAGFIFQNFRLIPSLTALENAALPLELLGQGGPQARKSAAALLEELGLSGRAEHLPSQLSGGEQQRVAIARAFIHGPELVFADEPTGALDRETAGRVLDSLFSAQKARGAALVVVTHDPAVWSRAGRTLPLAKT